MSTEEVFVQQYAKLFVRYRNALSMNGDPENRNELQELNEIPRRSGAGWLLPDDWHCSKLNELAYGRQLASLLRQSWRSGMGLPTGAWKRSHGMT